MSTLRSYTTAALGLTVLAVAATGAPHYDALGASDAVGVGSSNYNYTDSTQPNNGYVYRISDWLKARYPRWALENRGVSGYTAPQIRDTELDPAIAARPDVVTLWAGGNDVRDSVRNGESTAVLAARFEDAFTTILRRVRQETPAFIVTADIPDLSRIPSAAYLTAAQKQLTHDDCLAVNGVIAKAAAAYGVPVVDVYNDPASYSASNFWIDGFHPNDAGYLLLAGKFEAILRAQAWRVVSGLGDVDGDGSVNAADAALILSMGGGMAAATDRQHVAADVSPAGGDGAVDTADAVRLLRRLAGLVPDADWR